MIQSQDISEYILIQIFLHFSSLIDRDTISTILSSILRTNENERQES